MSGRPSPNSEPASVTPYTPTAARRRPATVAPVASLCAAPRASLRRPYPRASIDVANCERTIKRALEDRDGDAAQTSQTARRNATHAPGPAYRPDRLDQLGREGERDRDRDARFIEHGRQAAKQPVGTDERVGRTEAHQDDGDLQPEHRCGDDRLQGDGAADAHRCRPGRQRHVRHGEEHVARVPTARRRRSR